MGTPLRLRLAAGLLGLALVGSLGVGSMVSAQAEEPTAGTTASAEPATTETPAAVEPGADSGVLLAPESTTEGAAPAEDTVPSEEVATTASEPAAVEGPAAEAGDKSVAEVPAAEAPDTEGPATEVPTVEPSSETAVEDLPAPKSRALALAARLANPQLPTTCGLSIAIVLDLSNSLANSDVLASKNAAKAVVTSLRGTPSSVGVYTFATYAPDRTNTATAKTSVSTTAGATSVNNKIDQISRVPDSVGGTNWDAALRQIPQGQYDIVLFVTDGNPTAYGTPGTNNNNSTPSDNRDFGSGFQAIDLSTAVTAADNLKASGAFVMGLAVGTGINLQNIQAISGNRSGTDYFQISNYADLTAQLTEIALKNCQGTVSIVKQVRDLSGTLAPAAGWTFNSRAADQVTPSSAVTGADGAANFKANDLTAAGRTLQFTEVQQTGYVLETQNTRNAKCVNNVTGLNVPVTNSGGLGFTVAVKRADAISCEVINATIPPVQVTVTKTWVNAVDDDTASFTANTQSGSSTAPTPTNGNVITASFAQGTTVNVAEVLASANKGVYTTTLKCTNAAGATVGTVEADGLKGSFTLGASNVTCAFTNTNTAATVVVSKNWIVDGKPYDNGDQPEGISAALTLTGPGADGATAKDWDTVHSGYFAGNTVTIAETTTFASGMKCELTGSQVTLANGTTTSDPVPHAATLAAGANSFTVTNTVECATVLTLLKFIDDSNGGSLVPGDFTLTATPDGGTAQAVQGEDTVTAANTMRVTASANHTVSESSTLNLAYLQLSLQRYTGTFNTDGSLADAEAWEDAAATNVSVATGHHEVYRFVNASVPTMTLPLTGGTGSIAYLMVGGGILLLALLVTAWILVRRGKANRA
ncbi:LPXTG cell wall anchor domain-containing protein [Specibacter sp. NPDC078692]|uniref:LPXTG cell wall anchor domain-containing protein n=1 Tax=Specibacter sp. NPDC078692 TaxID=3155818 RepID=UPI0034402D64